MTSLISFDTPTGDRGAVLSIFVDLVSQNAATNKSTVRFRSGVFNVPGAWFFNSPAVGCALSGSGGVSVSSSFTWPSGTGSKILIDTTVEITHNPDGTFSGAWSASIEATGLAGIGGPTNTGPRSATLPRLTVLPNVPSSVVASRISDSLVQVSWSQTAASNGQPTAHRVQRSFDGGPFSDVAVLSPTTSVTVIAAPNERYQFRVRAENAAGVTAWSAVTPTVFTSPAAPTSVVAAKDTSLNIDVSWTRRVSYDEHQHVVEFSTNGGSSWSALATVASGTNTFKHMSPNPALVHVYRVRAVSTSGGLTSAWVQSNSVQLLTAPNAPTLPAFASFADKAAAFLISWAHNPVDTTAQTAYEVQFSTNGGSSWSGTGKVTSAVSSRTVAANTYAANAAVTVRVRTWGQATTGGADGTGASAWSTLRTVTFKTRPVATITSPADASTWTEAELRVALGFAQAEDGTFVSATLQLKQGSTVLETIQSTTLASTTFATEVEDGESYTITATVTSSHGITSTLVDADITVSYTLPVAAGLTVTYLEASGIAQLGVTIPAAGVGEEDAVSVSVFRTIAGVVEVLQAGFPVEVGEFTFLDTTPTINGLNQYRVRTLSEDGAARDTLVDLTVEGQNWAFLSNGPGFGQIVTFGGDLRFNTTPTAEFALVPTAGRRSPIALFGEGRGLTVTGSATLVEGQGSTAEEIEQFVLEGGLVCYRDPSGNRIFGTLELSIESERRARNFIEYTVTEAT